MVRATCRDTRGRGSSGAHLGEACGHQEAGARVWGEGTGMWTAVVRWLVGR
jgi:hypothetical protein